MGTFQTKYHNNHPQGLFHCYNQQPNPRDRNWSMAQARSLQQDSQWPWFLNLECWGTNHCHRAAPEVQSILQHWCFLLRLSVTAAVPNCYWDRTCSLQGPCFFFLISLSFSSKVWCGCKEGRSENSVKNGTMCISLWCSWVDEWWWWVC